MVLFCSNVTLFLVGKWNGIVIVGVGRSCCSGLRLSNDPV